MKKLFHTDIKLSYRDCKKYLDNIKQYLILIISKVILSCNLEIIVVMQNFHCLQ